MTPFRCTSLPPALLPLENHSSALQPRACSLPLRPIPAEGSRNVGVLFRRFLMGDANLSLWLIFSRCPKDAGEGTSCCKVDLWGIICFPCVIKCTLSNLDNYIYTLLQIRKTGFLLSNVLQFKSIVSQYSVPSLFRISGSFMKRNNYLSYKQKAQCSMPKLHWLWAREGVKVRIPK